MEQLLLRASEVAEALGVSRTTVWRMIRDGSLPSVKMGDSRRVRREDLEAFVRGLAPSPKSSDEEAA